MICSTFNNSVKKFTGIYKYKLILYVSLYNNWLECSIFNKETFRILEVGHLRNVLGFSDTNIWFLVKMKITFEINFLQLKWFNSHYIIY